MIIRVYMHWLYILLCAYRFIYKYRCLKAKVIKTNFLGNDMPKNMHSESSDSDSDSQSSDLS